VFIALTAFGAGVWMNRTRQAEAPPTAAAEVIFAMALPDLQNKTQSLNQWRGKVLVVNFWATWCAPCKRELNAIAEVYEDWQAKTGVKLLAISIDDSRSMNRVAPYVNGQGWEYEVYLDPNGDLKRAMNVQNVPHTFLLDGSGKVVWQHNVYNPGDENELYAKVKELTGK
jgi:thiol-disulfide isomerase/thioredoxin